MTSASGAPKASFRLSMLIYDTRYRSMTIQVIALALLGVALWWLRDNLVTNLADKGKDINFSFLWNRAGYDIDQQLISYTNDDTHSRALFVGLLNTLAVAFVGCIFATIIGVFAGVARLSQNWVVARLMTVYVEVFRNVPLLLWIILAYTVFSEAMPQVNDFKVTQAMIDAGTAPVASMWFDNTVALSNRGLSIPYPFLDHSITIAGIVSIDFSVLLLVALGGLFWWYRSTIARRVKGAEQVDFITQSKLRGLALVSIVLFAGAVYMMQAGVTWHTPFSLSLLALFTVFGASLWLNRKILASAKATQEATGLRPATWWKSLAVIILPTAVLLFALGLHWDVPHFNIDENGVWKGFNFTGGMTLAHNFTALVLALSLYTGAYIAEAVRAGILAVSRGQSEAAAALGLRQARIMNLVVLPQALRVIVPPLISQYLNLTKNTTLGMAVGYLDLKGTLGGITMNQTGRELESMVLMMMIYLMISLIISTVMNVYNASTKLKER